MMIQPKNQPSLAALIMGFLFLLVGLIFLIGSWGAYFTDSKIQDSGKSAEGHIVKKSFLFDAGGDSDYILAYWFVTESGILMNASRHVNASLWKAVNENQIIEIKYSASNPKRNFPTGEGASSLGMTIFASVMGGLFALFGGALTWGYFRTDSYSEANHD